MALARKEVTVTDEKGNLVTDAQVEVRREVAGAPLAVLYSDREGNTPLTNPVPVDPVTAVAAFHVEGGAYRIRAFRAGFERVQRYVGIGTMSETDAGLMPTGVSTRWSFDDATSDEAPGSGLFRLNHATPASATAIYVDNENHGGNDVSAWLDSLDDGGDASVRGQLTICDPDQPTAVFHVYTVSGSVAGAGSPDAGYRTLTVSHVAGAGSLAAGTLYSVTFAPKGEPGADGDVPSARTITAGTGLTGGGDLTADRSIAIDKASHANVAAAASDKVLTADLLASASGFVALTDAATVSFDWASGVNFTLELTTNRTLGNPSNGQPGTWRTIYLTSDGGPDTLSFGGQYIGPAVDDAPAPQASTTSYVLTIFCLTSSLFVASYVEVDLS